MTLNPTTGVDMTPNEELMYRHIVDLWGNRNIAFAYETYSDDIVDHMPFPGQTPSKQGMIDVVEYILNQIDDFSIEPHEVVEFPDGRVLDRWTIRGIHAGPLLGIPATGRRIEFHGMDIAKIENGQITELWHVEEIMYLALQLTDDLPLSFS